MEKRRNTRLITQPRVGLPASSITKLFPSNPFTFSFLSHPSSSQSLVKHCSTRSQYFFTTSNLLIPPSKSSTFQLQTPQPNQNQNKNQNAICNSHSRCRRWRCKCLGWKLLHDRWLCYCLLHNHHGCRHHHRLLRFFRYHHHWCLKDLHSHRFRNLNHHRLRLHQDQCHPGYPIHHHNHRYLHLHHSLLPFSDHNHFRFQGVHCY